MYILCEKSVNFVLLIHIIKYKRKIEIDMTNRRDFLKMSAASVGLLALNPLLQSCQPSPSVDRLGLQLYSIRDAMEADALGSLKKVSDIGYKFMELANYSNGKFYGYSPK